MARTAVCGACGADFAANDKGRIPRFCSPKCRSRAWRQRTSPEVPDAEPGANAVALEEMLPALDGADAATVQAARSLARLVDQRPADSAAWGRYLQALAVLRAQVAEREDAEIARVLAEIRGEAPEWPL